MNLSFILSLTFALLIMNTAGYAQTLSKDQLIYIDKKGVIRYTKDKKEAAFFGVNYTLPFAYGYRSVKALGLDLKKEIDKDVYHFARLGIDAFRVHVWDVEISDSAGNLLQNEHLDLFDYLLAELKKRGIKTIITPIAFWGNGYPQPDEKTPGFSTKWGKARATVNDSAIQAQENYLQQFFKHINPYTNSSYQQDVDVIAAEINNEPVHSGPKPKATEYVDRMIAAVKSTGWTKPLFYNISQNMSFAGAIAASKADGFTMQWYPSGLVANREVKGNFLPAVDYYPIPFDSIPAFRNKARIVYEFDAADILQSTLFPAMARSFKTAGFQWATQFAYDPLATAYSNAEYQTHYLNLAYTPAKAIGLMIASKVFHQVPRLKNFGAYPADSTFDVFRLSYKNDLSEMNAKEEFYHTNNTATTPQSIAALKHIAGVGSSPVVEYKGSGAYFLDKLEEGVWRLEIMPDAVHIRDPFERASPSKEVTRIEWKRHDMRISLPDLGQGFSLQPLNEGNRLSATVAGNLFAVEPGTYLLLRNGKSSGKWNASARMGYIGLNEFVAPDRIENIPLLRHQPVKEAVAGMPLTLQVQAVGIDSTDKISLLLAGMGRFGGRPVLFTPTSANMYTAQIQADQLKPGVVNYRIVLQKGNDYYVYPGAIKGNPFAWDYYHSTNFELTVHPRGRPVLLFNAATDQQPLSFSSLRRGSESGLQPATPPDVMVYRMAAADVHAGVTMAFQSYIGPKATAIAAATDPLQTLVVRGRVSDARPATAKISLITKDGIPFSATVPFTVEMQNMEIPLNRLQQDSMLLLPRPYPGFMPLRFLPGGKHSFSINEVEHVQVAVTIDADPATASKSYFIDIESIWIKK